NEARPIFLRKRALETVKHLGWAPDIVRCNECMTALSPLYLKPTYRNDPMFKRTRCVFTVYDNAFNYKFDTDIINKAKAMDVSDEALSHLRSADFEGFIKLGCAYSDAVIKAGDINSDSSLHEIMSQIQKPLVID